MAVAAAACAALRSAGRTPGAYLPIALGPGADAAVALLAEASDTAAEVLAPRRLATLASPLVAARHAGLALDPPQLLQGVAVLGGPDVLVGVLSGGLLAPLTPRYAVRDLARDFGAPLVVAVRADVDVVGQARLAVEAARAAGLHVAAIVLTGWPDPPGRVLLDERAELGAITGLEVFALPEAARDARALGDAAADWPVEAWLEPDEGTGVIASEAELVLERYREWDATALGDPRAARRPEIMAGLLAIVAAEGPMTATRAYALYNRAAGGRKLTAAVRTPLSSALYWLAQERRLVLTREDDIPWQGDDLVRAPDAPAVLVRELGPRALDEVPLDEVAELMRRLRATTGVGDPAGLKRAVLTAYGLVRLTTRADEYLSLAVELADA